MLKNIIPLWAVPVLILFATGTVWLRLTIVKTTYEISQNTRMIQQGKQELEGLQVKASEMRSPRRLEMLARTRFGLSEPKMEQVIHLGGNRAEPIN